jgi:TRAP-type C4-dicarboxylate transport system substrate-binding protein
MMKGVLSVRNKLTLIGIVCLVLIMAALPFMTACGEEEVTPPTTPTTTPTTPAEPEVISLVVNDHNAAEGPPGESIEAWAAWVEEQSGGRVELDIIHGGALLAGDEAFRGTQTNVCDVGYYVLDRQDGFLLSLVTQLPFMGWPDQRTTGLIFGDLFDEFPEMVNEWEGQDVKLIGWMMMPGTHLHNTVKEVRTPDDIVGMSFHCAESMLTDMVEAAGGTSAELDIADMFTSLQTGLLDGIMNHFPVLVIFGVWELPTYHTVFGDGINMSPMCIIMNNDVFNGLPADIQQIFLDSGPIWHDIFLESDLAFQGVSLGMCVDAGHTITYLTDEEIQVWVDAIRQPVIDGWLADCEAAGLTSAQEIYDRTLELIEEYKTP